MKFNKIPIAAAVASLLVTPLVGHADDDIPFEEGRLFFELNDTDGDLGIHGKIDGDEWKRLEIEDPNDRRMLNVNVRGRLRRQGLTELFFESAEPTFDELDPIDFFKRFPEGWYEIEGITLDDEERENETYLSHVIPAAPVVKVNGNPSAGVDVCQCDEEDLLPDEACPELPAYSAPVVLDWADVTTAHAGLGRDQGSNLEDHDISVVYYEVVVEIDDTEFKSASIVPPDVTSWEVPAGMLALTDDEGELYDEIKYEILVRVDNGQYEDDDGMPIDPDLGNKSAMESCFAVE